MNVQRNRSRSAVKLVMDGQSRGEVLKNLIYPHDELNAALVGDKFLVVEIDLWCVHAGSV